MLLNLTIRDLAIVETLDLDLATGFSVLTGETGAGKSILLTALSLALGDRADAGYIRPGSPRAEINLVFDLQDAPAAQAWLLEHDLDDGEQCLIRRVINSDGRSKATINGSPVTLQRLQQLAEQLVEIHGQHAHLHLLRADEQRRLLDEFSQCDADVAQLNALYRQWEAAKRELDALKKARQERTQREELLRYQLRELQQIDWESFDYAALTEAHHKMAHLEEVLRLGQQCLEGLYDHDEYAAYRLLGLAVTQLDTLSTLAPELQPLGELLHEAQIHIEEVAQSLRRFLDHQDTDPERLAELEAQLGIIHTLSRKHQVSPEALPDTARAIASELDALEHGEERLAELSATVKTLRLAYQQHAAQISARRADGAQHLAQRISAMIRELGMPQGEFIVHITSFDDDRPRLYGLDQIEFLVSANPGLPPRPLAKVASGGELSRISLAIQVATSSDKTVPTMIFDEVDSGIGGGIAEIVGRRLRDLSAKRQVLCVTHLPQVAAQAHQHLFVAKHQESAVTTSTVRMLEKKERINEIARMLGGVQITEHTLAHAQEMLDLASRDEASGA